MADNNIETRVSDLEIRMAVQDEKFNAFMQEMRDFKTEMRQQNEMRAAELRELRQAQAAQQVRHDENITALRGEMKNIANEVKDVTREVRNLFLTAAIGIGAMVITVIASMVYTAVQLNKPATVPAPQATVHTQLEHDEKLLPKD